MYYIIFELILREVFVNDLEDIYKFSTINREFYDHLSIFRKNSSDIMVKKIKCLNDYGTYLNKGMEIAIKNNYNDLMNFYIKKGANLWVIGIKAAAESGNIDLIYFFTKKIFDDYSGTFGSTWEYNSANVHYLFNKDFKYIANSGLLYGAKGGHKNVVDFFIDKGADALENAMRMAVCNGHKQLAKYLNQKLESNSI